MKRSCPTSHSKRARAAHFTWRLVRPLPRHLNSAFDLLHPMLSYLIAAFILFAAQPTVFAQATKSDKYLEAGIAAASREWHGSDYARAYQTLASGGVPLPKFSENEGARLLQRMTALENFSFHRNRSIPLQTRFEDFLMLMQGANSVLKLYYA